MGLPQGRLVWAGGALLDPVQTLAERAMDLEGYQFPFVQFNTIISCLMCLSLGGFSRLFCDVFLFFS